MKLCSRCEQPNPLDQSYCKPCQAEYGRQYDTHRKERVRCQRAVEGIKVKSWAYAYNLETGRLSEYSPSMVTHIDNNYVDTIQARYQRDEWHLTRNNYGPRWPIRDSVKFRKALGCAK